MKTANPHAFAVQGDAALRKLIEAAGDDCSFPALAKIALTHLPYEQDEKIAAQLLFSILLHNDLAAAIGAVLETDATAERRKLDTAAIDAFKQQFLGI